MARSRDDIAGFGAVESGVEFEQDLSGSWDEADHETRSVVPLVVPGSEGRGEGPEIREVVGGGAVEPVRFEMEGFSRRFIELQEKLCVSAALREANLNCSRAESQSRRDFFDGAGHEPKPLVFKGSGWVW